MSKLSEALSADLSGYRPMDKPSIKGTIQSNSLEPILNSMLRCPLPPIAANPDSLRQFYMGGQVPQMRLLPPPVATQGSVGGTTISRTVVSSSSGGGTTPFSIAPRQVSITTSVLNPSGQFLGSILMSPSFQLLSISANTPCRIELYSTQSAQVADSGRALDTAPNPGVTQNLISDVVLDTIPLQFSLQNRIGANMDSPQSSSIYITVTNLDLISETVTVTLSFVPLET